MLLKEFDAKQARDRQSTLNMLWKAAAVFLIFGTGWLANYLQHYSKSISTSSQVADTIYISKEVAAAQVKVFDTVYIESHSPGSSAIQEHSYQTKEGSKEAFEATNNLNENTNILSIKEAENMANKQKKNSMKDDSLLKKYNFVNL